MPVCRSRCACDLRIASDAASFVPAFINIGLVPDSGGTYFIAHLLGSARAFEWMRPAGGCPPRKSMAWGLVSEVVEADALGRGRQRSPRSGRPGRLAVSG